MALLQIHEPGQTPLPHSDTKAVGIDLGTTNSVVAVAHEGKVEVLLDTCGNALLPSVVEYAPDGSVKVGTAAHAAGAQSISSVKRRMHAAQEAIALSDQKQVTPVEVSAEILRAIKARAERALGKEVRKAVITVPAYFDDAARTATKDAAKLAGLEVLRLVNEPTAAALAYGLDNAAEGIYAIYDLGGGTFDISVLKLEKGVFQVLATGGDTQLGGDDFDHAIARHFGDESKQGLLLARKAKEQLSSEMQGEWSGKKLERATLNSLIAPLIARTIHSCEQVLEDAGLNADEIKGVVLVGGSTRVPLVREQVESFFGKKPLTDVDPDLVVAHGAALQAEALTRGANTLLLDVTPLSLGLETMGGIVEKIIHRNSPIPTAVAQEFTTYQDGQTGMQIHVVQGEREMVKDCRSLARFELTGIPPMVAGAARIKITFTVDADGLLTVSAKEQTTGVEQSVAVKPSYGLPQERMAEMLRDSMKHAREDMNARLLAEARSEAERSLLALDAALKQDGRLISPEERKPIEQQMKRLRLAMQGEDRDLIAAEADRLEEGIKDFAARRLEQGVVSALKGHSLTEVEKTLLTETN